MGTAAVEILAAPVEQPAAAKRRYDIDWIRVLAIAGVFFFHNARFFDPTPWHVKNGQRSDLVMIFIGFMDCWQMPMLMLVSGAGSWFALRSRSAFGYATERVHRLLVPYYLLGVLLLAPPQYYWECVNNRGYRGGFWELMPAFLDTFHFRLDLGFLAYWSGHLWFLHDLFVWSILSLPLLLWLKSERGRRLIALLAGAIGRPGGLYLPALLTISLMLVLRSRWPGWQWPAQTLYLGLFFLIGYVWIANEQFTRSAIRHLPVSLLLAAASFAALAYWVMGRGFNPANLRQLTPEAAVFFAVVAFNTWCLLVSFLGLAARYLTHTNGLLRYCTEAVLPFYVLHQTIILAVGWFVVQWSLGIAAKYLIVTTISFVVIGAIYELLVRRIALLRWLFGMRR